MGGAWVWDGHLITVLFSQESEAEDSRPMLCARVDVMEVQGGGVEESMDTLQGQVGWLGRINYQCLPQDTGLEWA